VLVPTAIPGLSVSRPAGSRSSPQSSSLRRGCASGIDALGQRFSHVVFDTGPLLGLSDALILAAQVEGVMLVLRHGERAGPPPTVPSGTLSPFGRGFSASCSTT